MLWFGLPGMLGAWLGASLARWVPGAAQLALFAFVMLVAAWRMLRSAPVAAGDHRLHLVAIIAGGAAVGVLSGLVGVGGGFLIVPALVLLAGVPMALGSISPISGALSDRFGSRPISVIGLVVTMGSFLLLSTLSADTTAVGFMLRYLCLLYTSPSPRDRTRSRMPSSA